MSTVLVTGATGTVGRHVVRLLHDRGVDVRALVRERRSATEVLGRDVSLALGDFADEASLRAALRGVDRVYLACGNAPRQREWESSVIDAAAAEGVRFLVKLSAFGAAHGSPVPFLDTHARVEEHLRASGLAHRVVRPTFLMSNLLASHDVVRATGRLFLPAAGARVAMVDPRDVAAVATALLTGEVAGEEEALWVSGPQALTFDDVAAHLSAVLDQPVGFVPVPDDAARDQLIATGAEPWFVDGVIAQFGLLREGAQATVSDAVDRVSGRPPGSVADFLRAALAPAAPRAVAAAG